MAGHRTGSGRAAARRPTARLGRALSTVALTTVTLTTFALSSVVLSPAALAAPAAPAAAVTELLSETFDSASVSGAWTKPAVPGAAANLACLTAGSDATATPVPGCGDPAEPTGSGALRLVGPTEGGGSVLASDAISAEHGLRIRFDSYQYAETALAGDGLALVLAAVDPAAPQAPQQSGPGAGSLGYSPHVAPDGGVLDGVPHGYLGVGLDVAGGFGADGGRDCPAHAPDAGSLTVRGPGNATSGYCLAGEPVDVPGGLSAASVDRPGSVPVEVAINPSAAVVTTDSGLQVPGRSWAAKVVGYDDTGAVAVSTGALPSRESLAALGLADSWMDEATGLPKLLALGFGAGGGAAVGNHEVANVVVTGLLAPVPAPRLELTADASDAGSWQAGGQGTITLTPAVAADGGDATMPVTVRTTLPEGVTPRSNVTASGYDCAVQGRTVSCTTMSDDPLPAGAPLPAITVAVDVGADARGQVSISSRVFSADANPVTTETRVSFVARSVITTLATPATAPSGGTVSLEVRGLPETASGTLAFAAAGAPLCSATLPQTSCEARLDLPVGTHTVTATYPGDAGNQPATATTTVTVQRSGGTQPATCLKDVVLTAGTSLTSGPTKVGGRPYTLLVQGDGNAVVYAPDGKAVWQSGTSGNPGARLVMQADGTLVVYSAKDAVLFAQITGRACSTLALQTDGNLVIYSPRSTPLWSTGWDNDGFLLPSPTGTVIPAGHTLHAGEQLRTASGYRLVMQGDGNLVVYSPKGTPVWASYSRGEHLWATVQSVDGNFVVYSRSNGAARAVWASAVAGAAPVELRSDGTLVEKDAAAKVIWTAR